MYKKLPSIYKITCLINGKLYIGSTSNAKVRYSNHFRKLRNGVHKCKHLQNAWNKYGESNFTFEIIEYIELEFEDKSQLAGYLNNKEQYYLNKLLFADENNNKFHELGYNHRRIANNNTGIKFSDESRSKMGRKG